MTCLLTSASRVHDEIGVRCIWASLPMDLLQLAFSTYSEFLEVLVNHMKVSLEFLEIPDGPHLLPFSFRKPSHRSSKRSSKIEPGDAFVGPVILFSFWFLFVIFKRKKQTKFHLKRLLSFSATKSYRLLSFKVTMLFLLLMTKKQFVRDWSISTLTTSCS